MSHDTEQQRASDSGGSPLDRVRTEFQNAWRSGRAPRIRDYLPENVGVDDGGLLRALLVTEIRLRRELGQIVEREEYEQQFPDRLLDVAAAFQEEGETRQTSRAELLYAEFIRRNHAGEQLDFAVWCAANPEFSADLRKLHGEYDTIQLGKVSEQPGDSAENSVPGPARGAPPSRYYVREKLAQGGMGVVYKVWDGNLNRELAMKLIRDRSRPDDSTRIPDVDIETLGRFIREAEITARLDHPGVVPIHDMGTDSKGRVFFTMRLVQGQRLDAVFRLAQQEKEGWSQTRALDVIVKVCETLAFAHARGIIHRDLKPANIMVGQFGETYVMDWGLAKQLRSSEGQGADAPQPAPVQRDGDELLCDFDSDSDPSLQVETRVGDVMGTAAYMAPEQAAGRTDEVDELSDIYSIGAILYELLTERRPYVEPGAPLDALKIIQSVVDRPPKSIQKINRLVPSELVAICEKAMARRRSQRYQSMADMATDLRAYLEHRVVKAYQTGAIAELRKWMQRNQATAIASALGIAVAVGGLAAVVGIQTWANNELLKANRKLHDANIQIGKETAQKEIALEKEIRSRQIAETERRRAEGLFLARAATDVAPTNPEQALLLARESAQRYQGYAANSALLAALEQYYPSQELTGHRASIMTSVVSPDGKLAATASQDGTAIVWDIGAGEPRAWLIGHQDFVRSIQFSSDGRFVVTGSYDKTAAIWNAETGERLKVLQVGDGIVWQADFSPDGRTVATLSLDDSVILWDVGTGREVRRLEGKSVAMQFSPSGRWLVTGSIDSSIHIWDLSRGNEEVVHPGDGGRIRFFRFSPDERWLLTTAGRDPTVRTTGISGQRLPGGHSARLWNTESWQVTNLEPALPVECAAFSHNGSRFGMAGADGSLTIWDPATATIVRTIPVTDGGVESLAFSPDDRLVAAGSTKGTISLWECETGRSTGRLLGHSAAVADVRFCAANRLFSAARDRTGRIWSLDRAGIVLPDETVQRDSDTRIEINADGSRMALRRTPIGRVALCSLPEGREIKGIDCPGTVRAMRFCPEGRWLAILTDPGSLRIYSAHDGTLQVARDGLSSGADFVLAKGGGIVIISGDNRTVTTGDVVSGTFRPPLEFPGMRVLKVNPDGKSLVTWPRNSPQAELWDLEQSIQTVLLPISGAGTRGVPSFTFSSHGTVLISRLLPRGELQRWDARNGELLGALEPEGQTVRSLSFDPLGDTLVTLSLDSVVQVWDATTGRFISRLSGHEPTDTILAVGPNAERLLARSTDGRFRLWDGRKGESIGLLGDRDDQLSVAKFSRDGAFLLGLNSDGDRVVLWNADSGARMAEVTGRQPALSDVSFSPDSQWFVTAHRDGSARIRPVAPVDLARRLELRLLSPHERELFQIGTKEEREEFRRQSAESALIQQLKLAGLAPVQSADQARRAQVEARRQLESYFAELSGMQTDTEKSEALINVEESLRREERLSVPVAAALSRMYQQQGDGERAERLLLSVISRGETRDSALWTSWAACCLGKLGRSPQDLLESVPNRASDGAADLIWLLERLAAGEPIRIHAGGGGFTAADGSVWRRDCFFGGGFLFNESFGGPNQSSEAIRNARDERLYQSERWFDREAPREERSYLIPLPPGRYEVVLHFAEIHFRPPEHRVMDVLVQGAAVVEGYDLLTPGFAVADQRRFDVQVSDGLLEIEFRGVEQNPKVSAIEISRLPD